MGPTEEQTELPESVRAWDTLGTFLQEDGWYPQQIEGKHIYRLLYDGKNGRLTCFTDLRMNLAQLLFYAIAPIKTPEDTRLAVSEFITRANFNLRIGNFELDFSDGEVRYKSSLDFEGVDLLPSLIRNTVYPAVNTMDRYLPGLMSVIYGGKTPFEAIDDIEGK
jgi:hypothetical protein